MEETTWLGHDIPLWTSWWILKLGLKFVADTVSLNRFSPSNTTSPFCSHWRICSHSVTSSVIKLEASLVTSTWLIIQRKFTLLSKGELGNFDALCQHLPWGTEEGHERPQGICSPGWHLNTVPHRYRVLTIGWPATPYHNPEEWNPEVDGCTWCFGKWLYSCLQSCQHDRF